MNRCRLVRWPLCEFEHFFFCNLSAYWITVYDVRFFPRILFVFFTFRAWTLSLKLVQSFVICVYSTDSQCVIDFSFNVWALLNRWFDILANGKTGKSDKITDLLNNSHLWLRWRESCHIALNIEINWNDDSIKRSYNYFPAISIWQCTALFNSIKFTCKIFISSLFLSSLSCQW